MGGRISRELSVERSNIVKSDGRRLALPDKATGKPLEPRVRGSLEDRFGRDLGRVLIHTHGPASSSLEPLERPAYTVGRHIVMAPGRYQPESPGGRKLLAHEVVHALQQRLGDANGPVAMASAAHEREAEHASTGSLAVSNRVNLTSPPAIAFGPKVAPRPPIAACAPLASALETETAAARATLARSIAVRDSFRKPGFSLAYWFAELYYYITDEEINQAGSFTAKGRPFVMHFIPIFYDMYAVNAEKYAKGTKEAESKIAPAWRPHFAMTRPEVDFDPANPLLWLSAVTGALISGVSVHILNDMPVALETAYRTYAAKYCDAPPFDSFFPDFDKTNKAIFIRVRERLIGELQAAMGIGIVIRPVDPAFSAKVADEVRVGLSIDEIFGWRRSAWAQARERLAK